MEAALTASMLEYVRAHGSRTFASRFRIKFAKSFRIYHSRAQACKRKFPPTQLISAGNPHSF